MKLVLMKDLEGNLSVKFSRESALGFTQPNSVGSISLPISKEGLEEKLILGGLSNKEVKEFKKLIKDIKGIDQYLVPFDLVKGVKEDAQTLKREHTDVLTKAKQQSDEYKTYILHLELIAEHLNLFEGKEQLGLSKFTSRIHTSEPLDKELLYSIKYTIDNVVNGDKGVSLRGVIFYLDTDRVETLKTIEPRMYQETESLKGEEINATLMDTPKAFALDVEEIDPLINHDLNIISEFIDFLIYNHLEEAFIKSFNKIFPHK